MPDGGVASKDVADEAHSEEGVGNILVASLSLAVAASSLATASLSLAATTASSSPLRSTHLFW